MQLVNATGAQNNYLFVNPQISFFKIVYRRHSNFSIQNIIETPDSSLHISNEDLQFTAARILEDIIERGEKEGWVKAKERKTLGQDDTIN